MQYRAEVIVADGSPNVWYTNAMRYDSKDEALAAVRDLAGRWMLVTHWRAVPDSTPEREAYVDGSEDGAW